MINGPDLGGYSQLGLLDVQSEEIDQVNGSDLRAERVRRAKLRGQGKHVDRR